MDEVFVGIDISKAKLDVAVLSIGKVFTVEHTLEGITSLVGRLAEPGPKLIVLETTGGFERLLKSSLKAG